MKKIALLLAVAISSASLFAQNVNKTELKQLKAFLAQPAAEASTNAEAPTKTTLPPGKASLLKTAT